MPRADTLGQFNEMEADCAANLPVHARGNVYRVKQSIVANFFARFQIALRPQLKAACCVSVIAISSRHGLSFSLSLSLIALSLISRTKTKMRKRKLKIATHQFTLCAEGGERVVSLV